MLLGSNDGIKATMNSMKSEIVVSMEMLSDSVDGCSDALVTSTTVTVMILSMLLLLVAELDMI